MSGQPGRTGAVPDNASGVGGTPWSCAEAAGVAALAVAAAVILTWPLAAHPSARLAAPVGPGDPYLNLWILGWDLGTLARHPLAFLSGAVFDANIFFPAGRTLAYSDHLLLQAVALWPVYAVTGDLALCYNVLLFGSLVAGVLAMYGFVRAVTGSRGGALAAGFAWGFMPFHFAHLLHLQLQSLYVLPLAFWCLHRLVAGRRRRDAVALGVVAALQAASSVYWGVIGAVALVVGAAALAIGVGRGRSALLWRRFLLAGVVGALVVAPFAWPYWQVQRQSGFARNLYEASQHEAVPSSYLRVPPGNVLYGRTGLLRPGTAGPGAAARHEGPEGELFPGFVLVALAAVGAWRGWRSDARPVTLAMLAVIATGGVLSCGPDGVRWLYAFLHRYVFGFQAVRAPARFGVLVTFGLAVLAAGGLEYFRARPASAVPRRRRVAWLVPGLALAALCVEYASVPLPTVPAPPRSTGVGQWLAGAPGPGAVAYLPLDADLGNTPAMVDSLQHRRPIVNGYSGQRPPFFNGLVDALARWPAPDALWTLRDLNVRFVVSPARVAQGAGGPLVERAAFGATTIYELVWTPEAEAAVPRPELPEPPAAGPLPFASRETLVYRVMWQSGASGGLAAGRVTVAADAGHREAHFTADLETARWVAAFFEAHDRFETWADAALLPSRQDQHLHEGHRVVEREARYDHAARRVTVGDGPSLPLPRGARDGLSAFFYARTLPLAPGVTLGFPVSEGGRTWVADVRAERLETVTVGDRSARALRVSSRLAPAGAGQGREVRITLWLSDDSRRVPLVLEIETGFGAFRAELESAEAR